MLIKQCINKKRIIWLSNKQSPSERNFLLVDILKFFVWNPSITDLPFVIMVTELGKLFPSIPLVAEEDSAFVHSNNLEDPVVKAVTRQASAEDKPWTHDDVLKAIDRGGKEAFTFGTKPATYWVGLTSSYTVGTITHPVFLC